jgi:hypothetical protein
LGQNLSATKGIGRQSIWGQNVSGQNETADRKYKQRETESVNIIMYHPKGSVGQNLPANSKGILGLSAESLLTQKKNESTLNLKFSYLNNSERDCLTRLIWTSINWMKNIRRLWNSSKVFQKG